MARSDLSARALLHSLIGGRRDAVANRLSDRSGELGERGGDAQLVWGFGGDFVVAAAHHLVKHPRVDGCGVGDHLGRCDLQRG